MILIQGAGIAGLTLAALLQHQGEPYRLIDHANQLQPVGAGLGLQANAQARLGIETAVADSGCQRTSCCVRKTNSSITS